MAGAAGKRFYRHCVFMVALLKALRGKLSDFSEAVVTLTNKIYATSAG